jgi:hypothetical protein
MTRFLVIVLAATLACACGDGAETPTSTTSAAPLFTTTTFANPFLDVEEELSNFAPGDDVDVVGIHADDQTWVGSFPADDVPFFGRLWPFDRVESGLVAVGEAASYQGGPVWEAVEQEGRERGYFPQDNTGVLGEASDVTAAVADLEAGSADELLTGVAETIALAEGLEPIQITNREFGGREVYYDLLGGSDPETRGQRLRVVVEETGESFTVTLVESQIICVSQVTDEGICS